jgi:peptidoglycan/LPS O-acetylase OafA/YrhL
VVLVVCVISVLPYLHDLNLFKGKKGFSGFSSLRIAIWVISLFVVAISGWLVAFVKSKGSLYRFVFLVPLVMLVYQLLIYVLDARQSSVNTFNIKILLNIGVVIGLALVYFAKKQQKTPGNNEL